MYITSIEIRRLGETQRIEYKKSLSLQKEANETLYDTINTDHAKGGVLFGVEPDGTICGIEPGNMGSAQKSLVGHVNQKFEPQGICNIEILDCEGKFLIYFQAERNPEVPHHEYDGRAYIREGSSRRQLSYEEKRQLAIWRDRDRYNGPWRCDHCGAIVGALNSIVITDQGVRKTYSCSCGGEYWPF